METNIILAGVGGQGILSIAVVIDTAALEQGLYFKQAEVHGMSQRGGDVQSHLRISDKTIHSDLVPRGKADLVLSIEPLESLRYVEFLEPGGALVTGVDPFVNIGDYPELEKVLDAIASLSHHTLVHADRLAREAGSGRAQNMVLLGAACPFLGLEDERIVNAIRAAFERKGDKVLQTNIDAYRAGKAAGEAYRACVKAGIPVKAAREFVGQLKGGKLAEDAVPVWKELLTGPMSGDILALFAKEKAAKLEGSLEVARRVAEKGAGDLAAALFGA
ncbi:MAG: indolepyruvate oxidoreductase subunit beta [Myxococcales bacterium]|jgi:indolepyruvate ferredoxin oxidoreductase beta subunit